MNAGAVLGQEGVDGKTNEITCFVPLLQAILDGRARRGHDASGDAGRHDDDGSGGTQAAASKEKEKEKEEEEGEGELVIVTADAMHTQEQHVKAMNSLGVAWMLILKDNQPGLYAAADGHPWDNEPILHGASETGHGRHEVRLIRVTSHIPAQITDKLPGTAQMMLIERYRHDLPRGGAPTASPAATPATTIPSRAPRHAGRSCPRDCPGRHRPHPRPGRPGVPARP